MKQKKTNYSITSISPVHDFASGWGYSVPHYHKQRFYNHSQEKLHGFFIDSVRMFCYSRVRRLLRKKPVLDWHVPFVQHPHFVPTITWVGHSTFLLQLDDLTILTDPIFGNASRLFTRIMPPGIIPEQLRQVDYVLISHNHRDHMDESSLQQLRALHQPMMLVPIGTQRWFYNRQFARVKEHSWWQTTTFLHNNEKIEFTFLPAHHWSQRTLFDRNKSLWGSWMIRYKNYTIYFAGDTAYAPHFAVIKERFPSIDVALMPIGPCQPRALMKHAHISAQEAGQAFIDLGARHFIPMHWGTFYFGTDDFYTPVEYLTHWWQEQDIVALEQLHILKFGQQWELCKEIDASLGAPEHAIAILP